MTLSNAYCTVQELKDHIDDGQAVEYSGADDANIKLAIDAASRWLDERFDTSFYARTETRTFDAEFADLLYIPDLLTVTTLKTDDNDDGTYEITWTAGTDYRLEPVGAAQGSQPKPYRAIRALNNGNYSFPRGVQGGVQIAGTWGYCTLANIPLAVKQAAILMAHRLYKRKDTIFGVAGTAGVGVTTVIAKIQNDSDIQALLSSVSERAFYA